MSIDEVQRKKLPDTPGVYLFLGMRKDHGIQGREVLYVGKATSLHDRVRSYFSKDLIDARGPSIVQMVANARDIKAMPTDSVLEALLLEADLIRRYKPPYNSKAKDNTSYNYVILTRERWPRVLIVRQREILIGKFDEKVDSMFGPFPHGLQLRSAMKIMRKIFPFRDTCVPFETLVAKNNTLPRPCFNAQIGLCPGVCTGAVTHEAYEKTIRNIAWFCMGKKKALLNKLEHDMQEAARAQAFERAGALKQTIFALTHIQDVALIRDEYRAGALHTDLVRLEGYDVAHTGGAQAVGAMTVVENGQVKKSDYRMFKLKSTRPGDDVGALAEILERRVRHIEWPLPHIIVIDGGRAQKNRAEKIIHGADAEIKVVSVVKDEHHKPREILGDRTIVSKFEKDILLANAEAHRFALAFHRRRRDKIL